MELLDKFKVYLGTERNLSQNTVGSYERDLKQFIEFIENSLNKSVTEVNANDVSSFIVHRRSLGDTISTTNRKLSAIKTFYNFLVKKGFMEHNPASSVEGGKKPQRLPQPIDEEDIERLFNTVDNLRDRVMMEVLYATGCRREELAKMRVSDINFRRGYVRIIGKGNKERIVPIYPEALELISEYIATHDSEWLFPSPKNPDSHISCRQINNIIKRWARKAGVNNVTPHKFRHSFCSHLYANGADIKTIQDLAGHSSPETTNLYTKINHERNYIEYLKAHPRTKKIRQPV